MKRYCVAAAVLLGLTSAGAQGPAPKTIACKDKGSYTGNVISPKFALTINDDAGKTWEYTYEDDFSGTRKAARSRTAGTYEIKDDLVVFTGKVTGEGGGVKDADELR